MSQVFQFYVYLHFEVYVFVRTPEFVCLSVCKITQNPYYPRENFEILCAKSCNFVHSCSSKSCTLYTCTGIMFVH